MTASGPTEAARQWWRAATPLSLRQKFNPAVRTVLRARARLARREAGFPAPGPLVVSGLLNDARGIGRAGRATVTAFERAGLAPVPHDILTTFAAGHGGELPVGGPGGVWLLHCNAPEALHALERLRPDTWRNRYRIGYWAYELPRAPREWGTAARFFDEIWTPSDFVARSLKAAGIRTPVRVMPHPVAFEQTARPDRARFGLPLDSFCVLCAGDFRSSATRKNLRGAIEAYCRAFSAADGARLIVKTLGPAQAIGDLGARPDVTFLHDELTDEGMRTLVASSDVLLSPHRSEGFGLTLAEAFLHGAPALATGWSGNMEFMADLPELQIPYRLVPVSDEHGIYRQAGAEWAEPDLDAAAAQLRALAASPEMRRALAERGRAAVLKLGEAWAPDRLAATPLGRLVRAGGPGTGA